MSRPTRELTLQELLAATIFLPETGLDPAVVRQHAARLRRAEPVLAFEDGDRLYLVDGYHRLAAAIKRRFRSLPAEIRPGTYEQALAAAGEREDRELSAPLLDEFRRNRLSSDLPADDATVLHVYADHGWWGSHDYLTPEESERIEPLNDHVAAARKIVHAYRQPFTDTYAGSWVEWTNGEPTYVVAFKGDLEPHRELLELPQVALYSTIRSRAELDALMEAIVADEGLPFWNLIGPDEKAGIVVVGGDGPGETEWRARMHERFGDAVRVKWGVSVQAA